MTEPFKKRYGDPWGKAQEEMAALRAERVALVERLEQAEARQAQLQLLAARWRVKGPIDPERELSEILLASIPKEET